MPGTDLDEQWPIGDGEPVPLDAPRPGKGVVVIDRRVKKVEVDWRPPNPDTSGGKKVAGRKKGKPSLQAAGEDLMRTAGEWGKGGGRLRSERIPPGNTPEVTAVLHANLELRMPTWSAYADASPAQKEAWDAMHAKLKEHEQRHVDIAVEECDRAAAELQGASVDDVERIVNEANQRMESRQRELDTDTDHGTKPGVQYGDVILDWSSDPP